MAQKQLWYAGLSGPLLYEDTHQYPDGEYVEGARLPQAFLDDAPSHDKHVVRLIDLNLVIAGLPGGGGSEDSEFDCGGAATGGGSGAIDCGYAT